MIYKVIDNYLDKKICHQLIEEADKITLDQEKSKFHNNRIVMTCTSQEFKNLCKQSEIWDDLVKKLKSRDFFHYCCELLNIDEKNFNLKAFFEKQNTNVFEEKAMMLSSNTLRMLPTKSILKFLIYRIFKSLKFLIFKIKNLFSKTTIELLFDYSKAGNGYFREIHRDSDERLVVFLLYLNNLDDETKGAELEIYNYRNDKVKKIQPQPSEDDCDLLDKIKPSAGRLLIFRNDDTSFHAVKKMENSKHKRHFLYGGFTITNGFKNPYIKNSKKMKTNFYIYY